MSGYDPYEKLRAYGITRDGKPATLSPVEARMGSQPITMSPELKAKMAEIEFEKEAVKRAYSTARDHVTDKTAVMELADDIQYLMMWAYRASRKP